jgi:hypothetical protein
MKKLAMLLVLAAVVPAMATITFTVTDNGDNTFTIAYASDGADAPRAIALAVSVDGDTIGPDDVVSVDPAFNTYMDYAYTAYDGGGEYAIGDGHPLAKIGEAGALDGESSEFSICLGVLDEEGNQDAGPSSSENLITLAGCDCTVTIAADTLRGPESGIAGDAEIASVMPDATPIVCVSTCYITPEHPDYDEWVAMDSPACWCNDYQCRGDADGEMFAGKPVYGQGDLTAFVNSWGKEVTDDGFTICADFDHAAFAGKRVYGQGDLSIFVTNWGQDPEVCE